MSWKCGICGSTENLTCKLDMNDSGKCPYMFDRRVKTESTGTEAILAARGSTHGDFRENGRVMQAMKDIARTGVNWPGIVSGPYTLTPAQRESVDMILHKVGRILTGNPNEPDHWDDIAGYATLISKMLRGTYEPSNNAGTVSGDSEERGDKQSSGRALRHQP